MKSVLDICVALKWVLAENNSDKALLLRTDLQNQVHELIAPDIFPVECAHALTKKERQKIIPDARALWDDIMADAPELFPTLPLMDRALTISAQCRHNVYDCLYISLAEREACELITADEKLIKLQTIFPFIVSLSSL